ncbi:hypothetical protein [Sphingomonas faeni]|uniref:hypothetical protein n=1 Tax=Sphingomonas faeni TaxID=185950 RepID=UPI00278A7138|nr:hypothetical protein [Sphingomonas faeni]MDQ0836531.1 hypothetical protein [Sphingomonas faeni]
MRALVRMSAGLIVWAIAFCLLYALHGLGCARGWATIRFGETSAHQTALIAGWLLCIGMGIGIAVWQWPARSGTLVDRTGFRLALIGVAATAITGLPIFTLPACF